MAHRERRTRSGRSRGGATLAIIALMATIGVAGCGSSPTRESSKESIEPVFAADYLESFQEVRDCRFSSSHPGMIRVLVNEVGAAAYLNDESPLPEGTIVLKEVFDGQSCQEYEELGVWSVMRKEAAGFDSDDGDWHWQDVSPDRTVLNDTKARCISCHQKDECVTRDYMCATQ